MGEGTQPHGPRRLPLPTIRRRRPPSPAIDAARVVVIGTESAGKSTLVAGLTEAAPKAANFRGSTVACEVYRARGVEFTDTPGIVRQSDSSTTRAALDALGAHDTVLAVMQATRLDSDLAELIPLVAGKRGAVAVTYWDKVADTPGAREAIERVADATGVRFVCLDARRPTGAQRAALAEALAAPGRFPAEPPRLHTSWRIEPRSGPLELRHAGPLLAVLVLVAPAVAAVWAANTFAGRVDPVVSGWIAPLAARLASLPAPISDVLAGPYGLATMGPLLLVWAVPTVVLYSLLVGAYKASGLADRLTSALHPLLRPIGLDGRDVVRVLMGFGCNVPAVVNTRACSGCTRDTCISAIAFGAACSYQLGATLAVFAAAGLPAMVVPYLLFLVATTVVYTRLVSDRTARLRTNLLVADSPSFMAWPSGASIWREARVTLSHFFARALPIFFAITLVAGVVDYLGVLDAAAAVTGAAMDAFRLPADAALPVILASLRKDGILLFAEPGLLAQLSGLQVLTGVYLAGVLLPCMVTALTISRERSPGFALRLLARQAAAAVSFTIVLAWGGALLL